MEPGPREDPGMPVVLAQHPYPFIAPSLERLLKHPGHVHGARRVEREGCPVRD